MRVESWLDSRQRKQVLRVNVEPTLPAHLYIHRRATRSSIGRRYRAFQKAKGIRYPASSVKHVRRPTHYHLLVDTAKDCNRPTNKWCCGRETQCALALVFPISPAVGDQEITVLQKCFSFLWKRSVLHILHDSLVWNTNALALSVRCHGYNLPCHPLGLCALPLYL